MKRAVPEHWSQTAPSSNSNVVFVAKPLHSVSADVSCLSSELSGSYAGVRFRCREPKFELLSLLLFHTPSIALNKVPLSSQSHLLSNISCRLSLSRPGLSRVEDCLHVDLSKVSTVKAATCGHDV